MSDTEAAKQHTLDDQYWRWHVIRECRVPDHYIGKPTKHRPDGKHTISPALTKSVLLNLAKWGLDQTIYEGVEHMAHSTQAPVRTINDAMRVLVYHGLITRTERPSSGSQKNTTLNWDKIEALREAFMPKSGRIEPETASDKQPPMAALAARPAPAPPPTPAADKMQRRSVPAATPAPVSGPPAATMVATAPVAAPAPAAPSGERTHLNRVRTLVKSLYTISERSATQEMITTGTQVLLPHINGDEKLTEMGICVRFIALSESYPVKKDDGSIFVWRDAFVNSRDPILTFIKNYAALDKKVQRILTDEKRAQRERQRQRQDDPMESGVSREGWDEMFASLDRASE
jgi:hypothetical protein